MEPFDVANLMSKETKLKICKMHANSFADLLERGQKGERGIRIDECKEYLRIWRKALRDVTDGNPLDDEALGEFWDFIASGEADGIISDEEEMAVRSLFGISNSNEEGNDNAKPAEGEEDPGPIEFDDDSDVDKDFDPYGGN